MNGSTATDTIRNRLVVKAVRNIRRAGRNEEGEKGMHRTGIKLDL